MVMKRILTALAVLTLSVASWTWALDGQSILDLKQAGISDQTIQLVIQEKIVETGAFSVKELVAFKAAGFSENTIQLIIREGSFMPDARTIVYGRDTKPVTLTSIDDLKTLKAAGFSDDVIEAILICNSREPGDEERTRAWQMLQRMGIIIAP